MSSSIESLLKESRIFPPDPAFSALIDRGFAFPQRSTTFWYAPQAREVLPLRSKASPSCSCARVCTNG